MNLQLSFVYQRRETFAALQALGISSSSLVVVLLVNTLLIGVLGGSIGVMLAFPAAWLLNWVAVTLTGFEGVLSLSRPILLSGFIAALAVSLLSSVAGTVYLSRLRPLDVLRS
jgi:putative ABC transport system permease protein